MDKVLDKPICSLMDKISPADELLDEQVDDVPVPMIDELFDEQGSDRAQRHITVQESGLKLGVSIVTYESLAYIVTIVSRDATMVMP